MVPMDASGVTSPKSDGPTERSFVSLKGLSQQSMPKLQIGWGSIGEWPNLVPWQSALLMTKTQVWFTSGPSQAAAPDATSTLGRGLMALSQACASICLVAHSRITKLLPRQHVSASESVSSTDLVPGLQSDIDVEDELMNQADERTAEIPGCSHLFQPPSFCLSWKFWPPTMDEGKPGGLSLCWVISKTMLPKSLS